MKTLQVKTEECLTQQQEITTLLSQMCEQHGEFKVSVVDVSQVTGDEVNGDE